MGHLVETLNGLIWSKELVYLCLGAGIYFSLSTRFLQVRHIKDMVKLLFGGSSSEQGVSSFQAFALSVSGRVGTGNIAGVATAIAMGGPGALFWMWAIAFLGAGSAYVESVLAQIYKVEKDGEYRGGPAYYIEKGLGIKWYAYTFAIATIIAMGFLLPGIQSNSIALSLDNAFGIRPYISGGIIVVLLGLIIFGGVKRISRAAEIIVPFMATGYIFVALIIIALNITKLPAVIALVFKSAFAVEPAFAGIIGMAISWGVKRGIYSNEAGQGTGPQAAAAAEVSHPVKQGLVQAFSVYIDTLFVCSATGFMILITGMYNVYGKDGGFIVNNLGNVEIGPAYTQKAVETVFPAFGSGFVAIALLFFAFSTLMAYYYIAETNVTYLIRKGKSKILINLLRIVLLGSTFYGSIKTAKLAWGLGDIGVGLMAWLNVIAILLLRKPAFKALKDYEEQKAAGKDPKFDPVKLGIKNADFWIEK
ncbi:alanine/glycine:cation symporter family protein [Tepidibacter thalassicus]|uniref:Alanine or glycine:cation symporter, AGCS family n=1 Tax=Tepidibacter thalassicus DSM 15285 TaxID=1123350 RepID=A0A1M5PGM5_9FIRM|nr:alanine/glycine:cation symporter family protein [Tepidibacter thalassicus]SHH00898.1 alanine or glycine:cation symporter, AGCS family [Tepidibacter thalassicus DSM 15285]